MTKFQWAASDPAASDPQGTPSLNPRQNPPPHLLVFTSSKAFSFSLFVAPSNVLSLDFSGPGALKITSAAKKCGPSEVFAWVLSCAFLFLLYLWIFGNDWLNSMLWLGDSRSKEWLFDWCSVWCMLLEGCDWIHFNFMKIGTAHIDHFGFVVTDWDIFLSKQWEKMRQYIYAFTDYKHFLFLKPLPTIWQIA